MNGFITALVPWATAGLGAGGGFVFIKWLFEFFAARWDKKEAIIDGGMKELVDELKEQIAGLKEDGRDLRARLKVVEDDLAECKRMHSESEAERLRLAAMLQGYGDARQHAQLMIAAEKAGGFSGA